MNSLLEAALKYQVKGLSVIPCAKDKKPLISWLPYQTNRASVAQIQEWWDKYPGANVGIITGKISGITVIDLDSQEAIDYFLANFKGTTPCVDTPRGMHAYFQYEEGTRNTVKVNGLDIDVRSDGGYVIAPPSVNAEGKLYRWLQEDF
jgi:putative DNA primase/helicase